MRDTRCVLSVAQALSLACLVLEFESEAGREADNHRWWQECGEAAAVLKRLRDGLGETAAEKGHLTACFWPQNSRWYETTKNGK